MKKKPSKKSPRIYRLFTEQKFLSRLKTELLVILYAISILAILFMSFDVFDNFQKQKEIAFQKEKIQSEIKVWQDLVSKFKDYKEGYYKLSVLEYEIGNIDKAKFYLNQALNIDPNFEKAKDLKRILDTY